MSLQTILLLITLFIGSMLLTYILMPKIIGVVTYKHLMDNPNVRSSHIVQVPSLGGIAFYIVLVLGMYFLDRNDPLDKSMAMMPGMLILFIIGLKDDLTVIGPLTKIGAQILAISFVMYHPSFHIHHLHGFFGVGDVSIWVVTPLAAFIMLAIINAYNLIDGIDGLASAVGIVIFTIFGLMFFLLKMPVFSGISLIMIGSLIAFLRFNLSSKKKIFMGDTGSMLIGFVIACSVVRIFTVPGSELKTLPFLIENLPLVVMAILIVPFFDTARVFTIRIMNKKSPFSPDRNHIHHILIDYLKLSHRRASFFIGLVNVLFIVVFIFLSSSLNNFWLLIAMIVSILLLIFFFYRINFSYSNMRRRLRWKQKMKKFRRISNLI
jgi:UDP-GlcNAc:undecaprenyl-phosphate GlcNAc-1-phosphate transferase